MYSTADKYNKTRNRGLRLTFQYITGPHAIALSALLLPKRSMAFILRSNKIGNVFDWLLCLVVGVFVTHRPKDLIAGCVFFI